MPNNIDRNANSASRQRRNWQRLTQGAVTNTITTSAPITGGSTIGLDFDTNSGLGLSGDALVILFADPSIVGSASGIKSQLAASSALSTTGTGLTVLIDGSTITLNGAGQLQASTSSGGGSGIPGSTQLATTAPLAGGGVISTGLTISIPQATSTANGYLSSTDWTTFNGKSNTTGTVTSVDLSLPSTVFTVSGSPVTTSGTLTGSLVNQASTLVFAGPATGASALPSFRALVATDIPVLSSTNLPADVAYTDKANVFTVGPQTMPSLIVSGNMNVSTGFKLIYASSTAFRVVAAPTGLTAVGINAASATTGLFNTAVGFAALTSTTSGVSNTGVGYQALLSNKTANGNTAVGFSSMQNTTGNLNTAIGYQTLLTNTTGTNNTAVGASALSSTTSSHNTAIGYEALLVNTTGAANTAVGAFALSSNTSTTGNTAVGFNALLSTSTTGDSNTAVGYEAARSNRGTGNTSLGFDSMFSNTTGSTNVALGYGALRFTTSGSYNIQLGVIESSTTSGITTGANNILIGNNLTTLSSTGSNNLVVGNLIFGTGLTSGSTVSVGNVGIGVSSPAYTLDVSSTIHTADKVLAATGLGVGNSAAASIGVGVITGKFEIFDAAGVSLGFVPIYASIT